VRELADVSRPLGRRESVGEVVGDGDPRQAVARARARTEVARQLGDVLAPLGERRQADRQDVEPIEQILAELAVRDRGLEVDVGGGDDAQIRAYGARAAERIG